jgi:cytosine/adenosine deaminase-related metal-dependent hydrolase
MKSLLICGGEVFTPDPAGSTDVLAFGGSIHSVASGISLEDVRRIDGDVRVIDAGGCFVVPGLVNQHNHMEFTGMDVGNPASLHEALAELVLRCGLPLADALSLCTRNPAKRMRLPDKGELKPGADADILVLERESLSIRAVVARGEIVFLDGRLLRRGTFERDE